MATAAREGVFRPQRSPVDKKLWGILSTKRLERKYLEWNNKQTGGKISRDHPQQFFCETEKNNKFEMFHFMEVCNTEKISTLESIHLSHFSEKGSFQWNTMILHKINPGVPVHISCYKTSGSFHLLVNSKTSKKEGRTTNLINQSCGSKRRDW